MKQPFVFRVQSERQNNYTTMQQGPECATMTRELCLEAENTYTPEMEFFFFFFWLMSIRYTSIRTNRKKQQGALRESRNKDGKKQSHEILMWYIYWQATRTGRPLWGLRGDRTCAWLTTARCRDTRTCLARTDTETHSQRIRNCEIITGWERGQPPLIPPEDQFWER